MADQEVKVRIITDASGAITGFQKVRDEVEKTEKQSAGLVSKIKTHWMGLTAAVAGVAVGVSKAWDLMNAAADYEERIGGLSALGAQYGMTGTQIAESMTAAARGMLSLGEAADMAAKSLNIGLSPTQMAEYTQVAERLSDVTGQTIPEAYDRMVNAAAKGRVNSLAEMGIIVNLDTAYEKYAKSQGKTVEELTKSEQQHVRLNEVLAVAKEKVAALGETVDSTKDKMDRFRASIENVKLMAGQALIRAMAGVAGVFQTVAASALKVSQGIFKIMEGYYSLREMTSKAGSDQEKYFGSLAATWQADAAAAGAAAADLFGKAKDNFGVMVASTEDLAQASKKNLGAVVDTEEELALKTKAAQAAMKAAAQQTIKNAQDDVKNLTTRLGEYKNYYDSLKTMMDQNAEAEKKHLEELKTIRQQGVDLDKSTASLIAGIKGDNKINSAQNYEASRSALNAQYSSALDMTGQDRIKALEDYKKAVADLQAQYAQGVPGTKDIFGKTDEIISAKTIAEDAISDIERATQNQKNALAQLTAEKQAQIEADQMWGQTLTTEAQRVEAEMTNLQNIINTLSAQIKAMETTITLIGKDEVTPVVDSITARILKLRDLSSQPITIRTVYDSGLGSSFGYSKTVSGSSYGGLDLNAALNLESLNLGSYASGTPYVPQTGFYKLHQGEAVIPREFNKGGQSVNINGDIVINVPPSAAADKPEDWRTITRQYIVPELRKLNS